ncbi:LysE family translocator [Microbulbifer sp. THAF38]|uniref:LysE family translocator n=1 Tax=Microbulbifer sp. THAF38 TaxID=2587856 RepID=UPI0012A8F9FA|nr:LysE family translocator [Microbulbifer sp. THAF38]QFT55378.1 Homoserine/homoserine lactone efflux protein [Microbulbifer sp. THAF38]
MSLTSLLIFSGAMLLLAITPGPGFFATIARALTSGMKESAIVVFGIVIGDIIFLLFAIYGLSAVAEKIHWLFLLIKYFGAAYLIYLGWRLWSSDPNIVEIESTKEISQRTSFFTGLFITLGNPKVIFFYVAFLPTFMNLEKLSGVDVLAISSVVAIVLGSTLLFYGYTAVRAKKALNSKHSQKTLNRISGATMIGIGTVLAVKA